MWPRGQGSGCDVERTTKSIQPPSDMSLDSVQRGTKKLGVGTCYFVPVYGDLVVPN